MQRFGLLQRLSNETLSKGEPMAEIRPDAIELPPTQPFVVIWDEPDVTPQHP
jgi:hypothetical protein